MRLKHWRKLFKVSQREFSRKTSIPQNLLSFYENEKTLPGAENIQIIAVHTDDAVTIDDWFPKDRVVRERARSLIEGDE